MSDINEVHSVSDAHEFITCCIEDQDTAGLEELTARVRNWLMDRTEQEYLLTMIEAVAELLYRVEE